MRLAFHRRTARFDDFKSRNSHRVLREPAEGKQTNGPARITRCGIELMQPRKLRRSARPSSPHNNTHLMPFNADFCLLAHQLCTSAHQTDVTATVALLIDGEISLSVFFSVLFGIEQRVEAFAQTANIKRSRFPASPFVAQPELFMQLHPANIAITARL